MSKAKPLAAFATGTYLTSFGMLGLANSAGWGPLVEGHNFTPSQWIILGVYLAAGAWLTTYATMRP